MIMQTESGTKYAYANISLPPIDSSSWPSISSIQLDSNTKAVHIYYQNLFSYSNSPFMNDSFSIYVTKDTMRTPTEATSGIKSCYNDNE